MQINNFYCLKNPDQLFSLRTTEVILNIFSIKSFLTIFSQTENRLLRATPLAGPLGIPLTYTSHAVFSKDSCTLQIGSPSVSIRRDFAPLDIIFCTYQWLENKNHNTIFENYNNCNTIHRFLKLIIGHIMNLYSHNTSWKMVSTVKFTSIIHIIRVSHQNCNRTLTVFLLLKMHRI
jgi:hypothetical protein